jgi:N-acetylmuramoyl-L-alanine amidase
MNTLLIFLFKSVLISIVMYGYYLLALKNRKLHTYNRFYLLVLPVISIVLPLLQFQWYSYAPASHTVVRLLQAVNMGDNEEIVHAGSTHLRIEDIALFVYGLVVMALLSVTVMKLFWLYRLRKAGGAVAMQGFTLVPTTSGTAPFSFFNTLYWRTSIDMHSEEGQHILRHELTHIRQHHTLDKLFMQAALIIFWLNPIFWLAQKELSLLHEFIADEAAVGDRDTDSFARMLLHAHYGNMAPYIVNPFFYSSIKRRLIMLHKTNATRNVNTRRLLVLPLLATMVFLFSFTIKKGTPAARLSEKLVIVLDAGHGGSDIGASGLNGIKEKDLTLKICRMMAKLGSDYNIDILQTRLDDRTLSLDERVQRANAASAGMFVSIHINKDAPNNPVNAGYEVIIAQKNREFQQSNLLASAVISSLGQSGVKPVLVNKGIYVLKSSNTPAIAIECGRMDNAAEMNLLANNEQLESLCRNILDGVVAYQQAAGRSKH